VKVLLTKLKILSQLIKHRIIFIALGLISIILVMSNILFLLIAVPYFYFVFINHKELFKFLIIICVLFITSLFVTNQFKVRQSSSYILTVDQSLANYDYTTIYGSVGISKVKVYLNRPEELIPGDKLIITGEVKEIEKPTIPGSFNYEGYLRSKRIFSKIDITSYKKDSSSFNVNIIRYKISKYIENVAPHSKGYIKTFVLADKSEFDQSFKENVSSLGISHLFAVSGMHVALIVLSLVYGLKKLKIKESIQEIIVICFLTIFLIITAFSPSVIRAVLMYILIVLNKKYSLHYSNVDILSAIFIGLLLINPYFYLNPGFTLSFLVTLTIILSGNLLKNGSKINQLFLIGLLSMLVTLPIISAINFKINLLGLIANVIFIFLVTYIILPLSFITLLFPVFDIFFYRVIIAFEFIILNLGSINIFNLPIAFTNVFYVIIYYLVLFNWFVKIEKKDNIIKNSLTLIMTVILISISNFISFTKSVNFIDVNGDSTVIIDSFNRCNMVIDTGEYDEYDGVINFLKSKNVKRIDILIITHNHSDHYGEFDELTKNFKVINIITSFDDENLVSNNLKCGSIDLYVYPPSIKKLDENNYSVVLILYISNKNYLFTGDIEKVREEELLDYHFPNIDYLKVAHHGSITSSSNEFIEHIEPKKAIIIVARNNRHNHPSIEVVNRFEDRGITTSRTDLLGTIEHMYIFGKEFQRYNPP